MPIQQATVATKSRWFNTSRYWRLQELGLRLVLGLLLLVVVPVFVAPTDQTGWLAARADDDDGPGGGGGSGPAGPSGTSGGQAEGGGGRTTREMITGRRINWKPGCFLFFCQQKVARKQRVKRPHTRVARTARPVQAVAQPQVVREFVAYNVSARERQSIIDARFVVIGDGPLSSVPGRILRLGAPEGMGGQTALRRLSAAAPGAVIARNVGYRSFLRPASRQGAEQGGRVLAASVSCAAGATIAMVDTGVDLAHPALVGANVNVMPMHASDRQPSTTRHGTAVASMLIGREGSPAPGLAPSVRLVAVDAFHRNASGQDVTDAFDLVRALDLLVNQDASVINLSLTGPDNPALKAIVTALLERGRVIVAAAGNDGPRAKPLFPAAYAGVIAVTAVDGTGAPWRRAANGQHVAFAALGVDLALAGRAGGAEAYTGTSFAAPVVSAMLAAKSLRPASTNIAERLAAVAKDRGAPGRDPVYGHGIVDPADACS